VVVAAVVRKAIQYEFFSLTAIDFDEAIEKLFAGVALPTKTRFSFSMTHHYKAFVERLRSENSSGHFLTPLAVRLLIANPN
jgi:hypothetical protein